MIKIEDLKKGDVICEIGSRDSITEVYVKSIGKKYIGVSSDPDSNFIKKFEKDTLHYTDGKNSWFSPSLFLGTIDEYKSQVEVEEQCRQIIRDIEHKISTRLGLNKLLQIKEIIEKA